MKKILVKKEKGRQHLDSGLISIKNFDREGTPPKYVTVCLYDREKEIMRIETLGIGDEISLFSTTYRVSSIEIRDSKDDRPKDERLLLEFEML